MKRSIYYLLFAATFFTACKKDDGSVPKNVGLQRTPQPQITKDGGSQAIDVLNLANFSASFKVGLYFAGDAAPSKMDVVIRKNRLNSSAKVYKAAVSTFPSTYTITSADLEALFGTPVVLNDSYDISVDVYTQSGSKVEAYPIVPNNPSLFSYGSGVSSQPGASLSIQYKAICAYNPSIYEGNFEVIDDAWADFLPGDVIELTRIDDTHISMVFPAALNPVPVVITINPLDNSATVAKQSTGSGWNYGPPGYPAPFVVTAGSASASFVSPCDQTLTLALNYGYSAGTFGGGPYVISMVKQ